MYSFPNIFFMIFILPYTRPICKCLYVKNQEKIKRPTAVAVWR